MNAHGCTGACNQGRSTCDCDMEMASTHSPANLTLVRSVPSRPPIQVSGGPVPRVRRVRRFFAALWDHLTAECWS